MDREDYSKENVELKKETIPLPGGVYPKPEIVYSDGNGYQTLPSRWRPWTYTDIKNSPMVSFVPMRIEPWISPSKGPRGQEYIRLDVNDLKCDLLVGQVNMVPEFFYNAYKDMENSYLEVEDRKRTGQASVDSMRPHAPNWLFEPSAHTFGLDINGRYLTLANGDPFLAGGDPQIQQSEDAISEAEDMFGKIRHGDDMQDALDIIKRIKKIKERNNG